MIRRLSGLLSRDNEGDRSRKNTISFLLSVLETVVAVGLTAIVSRLLPPESFGSFSVILSAVFVFGVFSQLGVAPIVLRETSALKGKEDSNPYRLWFNADLMVVPTTLIALVALIIFFWVTGLERVDAATVVAVIVQLIGFVLLGLRSAALQGYGLANFTHLVMFALPPITSGSLMLLLYMLGHQVDLNAALWSSACGLMVAAIVLHWRRSRLVRKSADSPKRDRSLIQY
jgi:O-antigen/teichoic acid export membrane protein